MLFGELVALSDSSDTSTQSTDENAQGIDSATSDKAIKEKSKIDGFLNIKTAHERDNDYFFGKKNTSAVGITPLISVGDNFVVDGDFYYGRMYSYGSVLRGESNLSKITSLENRALFHGNFKSIKKDLEPSYTNSLNKAHFYRNYTRVAYTNQKYDFKVVVGDTVTRNTIGFQQALSGLGISIFRLSGNGSIINSGSPVVITRVSKIECKIGDTVVATRILAPGVYYVDDLPEEAKLPGVTLKINDQLNRTEALKIDYFGGYGLLAEGKSDFDVTAVCMHKWDLEDPHRMKYKKKPRYSVNYRYGATDGITLGVGGQLYEKSYLLDGVAIFLS
ncbi:MAG: hypothetical protein LBS23_01635, partial [Holosporaceae bacterium]|nr:hypothetical protein [Holosporaceae bacterium]